MFVIIGERSRAVANSRENLCLTCWNYHGRKYSLDDTEVRVCMVHTHAPSRLRGPVSTCSDYSDKTKPNKHEMNKMAWVIEASKREVGFGAGVKFIPPSQRNDLNRDQQ